MGGLPLASPPAPAQLAAASTAAKASGKMAMELSRSRGRQQYLVARGYFHEPEDLACALLGLILIIVAGVPVKVVRQFQTLSGWDVQEFSTPAPAGVTSMALPADLLFSAFVIAFIAVLE